MPGHDGYQRLTGAMRAAHLHVAQNAAVKILPIGRKPCLSQQSQGDIGNFVGALIFHQAAADGNYLMRARAVNAVIQADLPLANVRSTLLR